MKRILISSFLLWFCINFVSGQSINESFLFKVVPDQGWTLQFNENNTYEYFTWNGYSGTQTLDFGNYTLNDGMLKLKSVKQDSSYVDEIPRKLFYKKIRLKKEETVNCRFKKEKKSFFGNKVIVLTEDVFHDSLIIRK